VSGLSATVRRLPPHASTDPDIPSTSPGNPNNVNSDQGWTVFNAVLGWSNNASIGTVLSYVFYWLAVFFALIYMKWSEGRVTLFGFQSAAGKRRDARAALKAQNGGDKQSTTEYGQDTKGASIERTASEESYEKKTGAELEKEPVHVTELA
jgi:hypothetical protein